MNIFRRLWWLATATIATTSNAVSASQTGNDTSDQMLWAFLLAAPPVAYAGNKWWRWGLGFRLGAASGASFFAALKWTLIAAAWAAVVMVVAWLMLGK